MMKESRESICLPDFDVMMVQDGIEKTINLVDFVKDNHQGLILYFYPKDNTVGCSVQASEFTQLKTQFGDKGYQIIGVSRDGIKSHHNFIHKKSLGIALISDADEALCQHFDVIKEKKMYGKTHLGIVRSTFVFDEHGQIKASFRNIKAKGHAQALLDIL
ncbi:peroxiredoxin [Moraxella sp. Tifton1]|uniref:peroxiredoxin n=1 Tax=Moraxella oculi TaxID=2940516 RepID=UPI002012FEAB|nr:peroxiredoxin [Moraxella sp. Tifton1]MCL1623208.1 peroxiredoxin [Moraxella sp. Tifton1]